MDTHGNDVRSVNYDPMDEFQREAGVRAPSTNRHAERFGMKFLSWTRGESVQVFWNPEFGFYEGRVLEDLGTKELVASALADLMKIGAPPCHAEPTLEDTIAKCTFAMAANDLITLGIMPTDVRMGISVGRAEWFKNRQRYCDLITGWMAACDANRCVWTGGETAQLSDVIMPDAVVLCAAISGRSIGDHILNPATIQAGDRIVIAESSGIHANGLTDARSIARDLPDGYLTEVVPGKTYGEMLLRPTHFYRELVEECLRKQIALRYCVNITGHGWRKFMRAPRPFHYVLETLPELDPIFPFIQKHGGFDDRKMYGTFNMHAGFGLIIAAADTQRFLRLVVDAFEWPFRIYDGGHVEDGEKSVEIRPLGITFDEKTLRIR